MTFAEEKEQQQSTRNCNSTSQLRGASGFSLRFDLFFRRSPLYVRSAVHMQTVETKIMAEKEATRKIAFFIDCTKNVKNHLICTSISCRFAIYVGIEKRPLRAGLAFKFS